MASAEGMRQALAIVEAVASRVVELASAWKAAGRAEAKLGEEHKAGREALDMLESCLGPSDSVVALRSAAEELRDQQDSAASRRTTLGCELDHLCKALREVSTASSVAVAVVEAVRGKPPPDGKGAATPAVAASSDAAPPPADSKGDGSAVPAPRPAAPWNYAAPSSFYPCPTGGHPVPAPSAGLLFGKPEVFQGNKLF